jgi:alpha-tubulin suppressor-like RCC1 family protein
MGKKRAGKKKPPQETILNPKSPSRVDDAVLEEALQLEEAITTAEAEVQAAEALIQELERELLMCEQTLGMENALHNALVACERSAASSNSEGGLSGGNAIYLYGDFAGIDPIVKIGGEGNAFYAISAHGTLWIWGGGSLYGGTDILGKESAYPWPMLVQMMEPAQELASTAYDAHTLLLADSGDVYSSGRGYYHDGVYTYGATFNTTESRTLVNVTESIVPYLHSGERVVHVYVGVDHSYLLTSEGRVLFGGETRDYCEAGFTSATPVITPLDITGNIVGATGARVVKLIVGDFWRIALTDTQRAFAWGNNGYGETGVGDPAEVGYEICPPAELTPHLPLAAGEYIVDGDTNEAATIVWTNRGNLYYMGEASYPFMGHAEGDLILAPLFITDGVVEAALADALLVVVKEGRRSVYVMGDNPSGMGNGTDSPAPYLTDITPYLALAAGETIAQVVVSDDEGGYDGNQAAAVAILTSNGRVLTFGNGYYGALGNGNFAYYNDMELAANSAVPIDITANLVTHAPYVTGVLFGGRPALGYEVLSDHVIRVIVPPGAALGPVDVQILGNAPQVIRGGYEYVNRICII